MSTIQSKKAIFCFYCRAEVLSRRSIGSANLLVNLFSNLILICFPVFFGAAGIPAGQAPPDREQPSPVPECYRHFFPRACYNQTRIRSVRGMRSSCTGPQRPADTGSGPDETEHRPEAQRRPGSIAGEAWQLKLPRPGAFPPGRNM